MSIDKGYDEDIEPIEDFDAQELLRFFGLIRGDIETLCMRTYAEPDHFREITEKQVDYKLRTLAHSIKKSLIRRYPDRAEEILTTDNVEYAEGLGVYYKHRYPLGEGAIAIREIYTIVGAYRFYNEPDDKKYIFARLLEMETAIKDYKMFVLDSTRRHKHIKMADHGQRGGRMKMAIGIVQAIVDHGLPHRRDLCAVCIKNPVPFELRADSVWKRFKEKHSCNINFVDGFKFDEEAFKNSYRATTRDREYFVFYNKHTDLLTAYCLEDDEDAPETWSMGTLKNHIARLRKLIKKYSR